MTSEYRLSERCSRDSIGVWDIVWPDPIERLKCGCVRLCGVVRVEMFSLGHERLSLGFSVIVTFVFLKSFKDVLSIEFVLLVDVVNECCDVRL